MNMVKQLAANESDVSPETKNRAERGRVDANMMYDVMIC